MPLTAEIDLPASAAKNTQPIAEFVRVPSGVLRALDCVSVDLFLQQEVTTSPKLYHDAGTPLANGVQQADALFVRAGDYAAFSKDLVDSLDSTLASDKLPVTERFELMQCAVSMEVEQSLRMVSSDTYIEKTATIGKQIVGLVNENQVLPADLFDIVRHDHHTFVHVTNVAGYVTLLAKELGISDRQELEQIAVGGLLHDLGKRYIPTEILNKTSKLTDREWELIRQHPQTGYEELCQRESVLHAQLMMTYQHHEHIDGNGYPVGITEEEMHPWAKMLAVVDVFDALTGNRPYRKPASCEETLEFLNSKVGTQFDEEMVACWNSAMSQR